MNEIGDVVFRKNIVFKDSGKLDYKINGHPTINITEPIDGYIYFIVMSTSRRVIRNKLEYLPVNLGKMACMSNKTSYINVNHIYKTPILNEVGVGRLNGADRSEVLRKIYDNFDTIFEIYDIDENEKKKQENALKSYKMETKDDVQKVFEENILTESGNITEDEEEITKPVDEQVSVSELVMIREYLKAVLLTTGELGTKKKKQ